MTVPIDRDRQIELMKGAKERANSLVSRLMENATVKAVASSRSLKESEKVRSSYQTMKPKKHG